MNWLGLKAKLYGFGALLVGAIAFVIRLRVVTEQRDRARDRADAAERQAAEQVEVAKADATIEAEHHELEHQADEAIENDQVPDNLSDPNRW